MTHAHGGEGSRAHSELSWVQEKRLTSSQRPKELLPVQVAGESQAGQVARTQWGRTVCLHHQRRQARLLALARVLSPLVLSPGLGAFLLQAPQAKRAVPTSLRCFLAASLGAAPLPGAFGFGQASSRAGVPRRAAAQGRCCALLARSLQLSVAVG